MANSPQTAVSTEAAILPTTGQFLDSGKTGVVHAIDSEKVPKEYHEGDEETELRVYRRLGQHPHIAKLLETRTDGSIVLERGISLRKICRAPSANEIPIQTKYLHSCGIVHADVGCSNWILTGEDHIKLIDFEGCSIDGDPADSCYEWFSYCRSEPRVSRQTDIFAFGCAIYEVLTGRPPYHELQESCEPSRQVEKLYVNQRFPDVAKLPLGQLMQRCWHGQISSMSEVIQELEAFLATLG
ncbi:kinase-like domain-containing protein [Lineolata rhizophorae]|uniref:Kinase-like domain-containing protein n=1 Tax=Lineolata rhizophorae TaxID=578093 RepID=A0A6A6NMP2_9PEZI|nr:kinase-like domain-containing protein [Lineolata rhizophorae]